ncbi:MAG: hypothetical protein WCY30_05540 [Candidatus Neomarinimicrobiota bacterium]|jgi:hypothetical protein
MPLFKIQIGLAEVSLECSQSLSAKIRNSVFSAIIKSTAKQTRIHYNIQAQNERFELFRNNRLTHRNRHLNRIIYALEWQIVNDLINQNPTALKLHAAALTWQKSGLIFCGAPSTGKTSLSILLMQNGWQLCSDEFAFLNPNGKIIPFPRNLIIKPHLREHVFIPPDSPVFPTDNDHNQKKEAYYLSPRLFGSISRIRAIHPVSFIFLEKDERRGFNLKPIARYAAFRLFMQHLFNPHLLQKERLDRLINLLNICPVYSLRISSPLEMPATDQKKLLEKLTQVIDHD